MILRPSMKCPVKMIYLFFNFFVMLIWRVWREWALNVWFSGSLILFYFCHFGTILNCYLITFLYCLVFFRIEVKVWFSGGFEVCLVMGFFFFFCFVFRSSTNIRLWEGVFHLNQMNTLRFTEWSYGPRMRFVLSPNSGKFPLEVIMLLTSV